MECIPNEGFSKIVISPLSITEELPALLSEHAPASRYVVVSDQNVAPLWMDAVTRRMSPSPLTYTVPPGEGSKCRHCRDAMEDFLLENKCDRDVCLVALGGGVVGDLTGFVASTYMRGVAYVQIPTTLLAMVDSSVGGKTAIDVPLGKNLIGSFHMPRLVIISACFLETLPMRHIRNGFAEIVKAAFLADASFVDDVEALATLIGGEAATTPRVLSPPQWCGLVRRSVEVKIRYVAGDERDSSGVRGLLNLGHTVGHAVEALGAPGMLHGEAVAIGMSIEARIGRRVGANSQAHVARIESILSSAGLPTSVPSHIAGRPHDLMEFMQRDKKNCNGMIHMALLEDIGRCRNSKPSPVPGNVVRLALTRAVTLAPPPRLPAVSVTPPGSKSITNRVLELCVLGRGQCRITGALYSTDTAIMMQCLERLSKVRARFEDKGDTIVVRGCEGKLRGTTEGVYVGNSGTSARFVLSLCCLCEPSVPTVMSGSARMSLERPIAPLLDALRGQGAVIECTGATGTLPLNIQGTGLRGGEVLIDARASSQFVSSLLMAAPYAREEDTRIVLSAATTSEPYVNMTIAAMADFGVEPVRFLENGLMGYNVPRGVYRNPATYVIEPDASAASALLAIAAITGGVVTAEGMGSMSRQGDAYFGVSVLGPMGCEVVFEEWRTTVTGPVDGKLQPADLDLSMMPDTFMTAAVLLAGAKGVSTIRGIATQRVKESNRIEAMVRELGRFGVRCSELEDGIEIRGMPFKKMNRGVVVECYNDHRIAMAFAVLSFRVEGIIISDSFCVDKTYPHFWDVMATHFQAEVTPAEVPADTVQSSQSVCFFSSSTAHVSLDDILRDVCFANEWNFVDLTDGDVLEDITSRHAQLLRGTSRLGLLNHVIQDVKVVTVPTVFLCPHPGRDAAYAAAIAKQRNTVFVMDSVDSTRLRDPSRACTRYDILANGVSLSRDVARMVTFLTAPTMSRDELVTHLRATHMISLTYGSFAGVAASEIEIVTEGCDVAEVRADFFDTLTEASVISELSLLRQAVSLPVMFTLRSVSQGGRFAGSGTDVGAIMRIAIRQGCELIDVETTLPEAVVTAVHEGKGRAIAVSSHHDVVGCDEAVARREAQHALQQGADVVKIVGVAGSVRDCVTLVDTVKSIVTDRPWMAIATGSHGALSRALSATLTPVTHERLPTPAAKGQLTLAAVNRLRCSLGMISPKDFFVVGHPVAHSLSPLIHNTAFAALGLPHVYSRVDTTDVETIRARIHEPSFGGASVTIPHKVSVMALADVVSEHTEAIGAVNTLVPMGCLDSDEVVIYGDNTDWIALRRLIDERRQRGSVCRNGLVLGAGGAARSAVYALLQLQCQCVGIYNRTVARAQEVAASFKRGVIALEDPDAAVSGGWDIVISTLPADSDRDCFPSSVFEKQDVVVVDMAYVPGRDETEVLMVASFTNPSARCVTGVEVLVAQAAEQFKMWTCHNAPKRKIWDALREHGIREKTNEDDKDE